MDTISLKGTLVSIHSIRNLSQLCCLVAMSLVVGHFFCEQHVYATETSSKTEQLDYHFDETISRRVLEDYLERSVTMAYFWVTGKAEGNREYPRQAR